MVEGSPRCHWPHTRRGRDRSRRLVTGPGRAGVLQKGWDRQPGGARHSSGPGWCCIGRSCFALVTTGIGLIFYFGPDADQDWVWISPGAVAATILWLLVSLLFKLYIANFTDYEATYGTVGGVIVVLLWFYLSGIAILAGAELNAEIEHASPYGKAPGQKSAHGKLLFGRRAARAFRERQRSIESRLTESASTRARGSHLTTRPERTITSPVALRTSRSTERRATRKADLVRIAVNTLIAVGWMRLAWRSTRLFRRAAIGAVVIGAALALDTGRARD